MYYFSECREITNVKYTVINEYGMSMDHKCLFSPYTLLDEILRPVLKQFLEHLIQQDLTENHSKHEKYTKGLNQTVNVVLISF